MEHHLMEWSPAHGWLAFASHSPTHGQISFCTHTGTNAEGNQLSRTSKATCLTWHPHSPVVAVGWEDGTVMVTSPMRVIEETLTDNTASIPISCLAWNVHGSHLCVADQKGIIQVFKVELRKPGTKWKRLHDVNMKEGAICMCTRNVFESIKTVEEEKTVEENGDEFDNAMKERQRKIGVRLSQAQLLSKEPQGSLFIIGSTEGTLFGVSQEGQLIKMFQADAAIHKVFSIEQKSMVVALTEELMLYQILIASDHTGAEKIKAKLPGKDGSLSIALAEGGTLIMSSNEKEIRVWDLISEENYTLALLPTRGYDPNDTICCVSYSKKKGTISGGTAEGKIATWRRKAGQHREPQDSWRLQNSADVEDKEKVKIMDIRWSPTTAALAVNTGTDITVMRDDNFIVHFKNKIAAVQVTQNHFALVNVQSGVSQDLKLPFVARGIHVADKQLVVWSGDTIMTYDVQTSLATFQSTSFTCTATDVALYNQNLYCLEAEKINIRTLQGTIKQIVSLPEMEGDAVSIDINRNWMAISTSNGFLRIYDLSRRVNETSDKVLIWDAEADNVGYFSFDKGMTDQQEYEAEAELASTSSHRPVTAAARKMEREQSRYRMMTHKPGPLHWDEIDPRFLVVEAVYQNPEMGDNYLLSMFVTAEHGIQLQDLHKKSNMCEGLIGVNVPHLYFNKKLEYDEEEIRHERTVGRILVAKTMREFAGLENSDEATRKAMLDFCYYLTLGHMDEAFKAIKFIKSESVWKHMAEMCVKTRRLDVAAVCLGNMGQARGARALRRAQRQGASQPLQCATLAVQLNMLDEAQALYSQAGRFDLVNKMLQAQNAWNGAFDVAEKHDRIHLRNTYYNYAQFLEQAGAIEQAIEFYEKSETHNFEIPRMFVDNPRILESYVRRKRDPELQKWWARYLESIGELDGAINFYKVANDHLSVVRIKCYQGRIDEAAQIATESADRAACYHLARIYEADGNFAQAVHYYTKAYAFSSAIRLAKEHDMKDQIANLSLMAGGSDLVEAARYYEELPGYAHKAVMLYHKAGMIGRALDLASRTEQFSALDLIAKDLNAQTDPTTLKRASEFFANNQNFEKAVELLCLAKDFRAAIDLCNRRNVRMTEKLAELLTPTKETTPNPQERKNILEEVAELCVQQGSYQYAAKKYTQAGDKLTAMRALLKSGDTAKIRFFANTARSKDIYILAANYMQSTDWRGNAEIMKDIETFYNKAQSYEHLSSYFQACAFMEIEDYRDFFRAAEALNQAQTAIKKGIEKGKNVTALTEIQEQMTKYQTQVKKFMKIKEVYEKDKADAVRQLTSLAQAATEGDIIRPAHILALLIGHYAERKSWKEAHRCIKQLQTKQPTLDLATVVTAQTLDMICDELKVERVTGSKIKDEAESDNDDEVDFSHAMKRQQKAAAETPAFLRPSTKGNDGDGDISRLTKKRNSEAGVFLQQELDMREEEDVDIDQAATEKLKVEPPSFLQEPPPPIDEPKAPEPGKETGRPKTADTETLLKEMAEKRKNKKGPRKRV